ncbi:hypothetical protein Tco_1226013 [Tanacetum coccineum]
MFIHRSVELGHGVHGSLEAIQFHRNFVDLLLVDYCFSLSRHEGYGRGNVNTEVGRVEVRVSRRVALGPLSPRVFLGFSNVVTRGVPDLMLKAGYWLLQT